MEDVGLKRGSRTARRVVTPQLLDHGGDGDDPPGIVVLRTGMGGTRIVDMLVGDPLPRIC